MTPLDMALNRAIEEAFKAGQRSVIKTLRMYLEAGMTVEMALDKVEGLINE